MIMSLSPPTSESRASDTVMVNCSLMTGSPARYWYSASISRRSRRSGPVGAKCPTSVLGWRRPATIRACRYLPRRLSRSPGWRRRHGPTRRSRRGLSPAGSAPAVAIKGLTPWCLRTSRLGDRATASEQSASTRRGGSDTLSVAAGPTLCHEPARVRHPVGE